MDFKIIKTEEFESFLEDGVFKMKYSIFDWIIVFIFMTLPIVGCLLIMRRFIVIGLFLELFAIISITSMPMLVSSKVTITLDGDIIRIYHKDREVKADLVIMEDGYYNLCSGNPLDYISTVDGESLSFLSKYSIYVYLEQVLMILRGTGCLSTYHEETAIE